MKFSRAITLKKSCAGFPSVFVFELKRNATSVRETRIILTARLDAAPGSLLLWTPNDSLKPVSPESQPYQHGRVVAERF